VLLDLPLQRRLRHRTDHGVHVLAVLEEQDAGDRAHVEAHRGALVRIDVDLGHLGLADVLPGELVEDRRHDLARPAPRRPEIDEHQAIGLLDLRGERRVGDVNGLGIRRGHDVILL
jgi:hypothetical protein